MGQQKCHVYPIMGDTVTFHINNQDDLLYVQCKVSHILTVFIFQVTPFSVMTAGQKMMILVAIPAGLENQVLVEAGIMYVRRCTQERTVWSSMVKTPIMN